MPAGSSRGERLDPFALPLRFEAADHTADGHLRLVELYRERVVLRRDVRGIPPARSPSLGAHRAADCTIGRGGMALAARWRCRLGRRRRRPPA
jgi:hypothetical protein